MTKFLSCLLSLPVALGEWTPWFSEPGRELCNGLVKGVECGGSFCDNLRLDCDHGWDLAGPTWTGWFSDGTKAQRCPRGQYITGMQCRGWWCDDVRLECSVVPHSQESNCRWREWFSDGSGPQAFPEGSFAKGARCRGAFCDDMQFEVCDVKQQCVVSSRPVGFWSYEQTLVGMTTIHMKWGITSSTSSSNSVEWRNSLTASLSTGFDIKGTKGTVSISGTVARNEVKQFSQAWSSEKVKERTVSFLKSQIGKALWKFEIVATDSCGGRSTIVLNHYALTDGRFKEPCCLPGWAVDDSYEICSSEESLISTDGRCSVRPTMPMRPMTAAAEFDVSNATASVEGNTTATHEDGGRKLSQKEAVYV